MMLCVSIHRRAMTVYEYFVAQGVKPADMGVDWQGKAKPRVPTPKKEPQTARRNPDVNSARRTPLKD